MASCCWFDDFQGTVSEVIDSWENGTDAWQNLNLSGDVPPHSAFFSGLPDFLRGNIGQLAWRIYSDALSQYSTVFHRFHHTGRNDVFAYGRSSVTTRSGGLHPIAVLVAPDGYVRWHTPTWRNKFHYLSIPRSSVYGNNIDTDFPAEVKQQQYYVEFIAARNVGFPNWPQNGPPPKPPGVSELDVDINLGWVNFNNLDYAGFSTAHTTALITRFGGGLHSVFSAKVPRVKIEDGLPESVVVVPAVVVDYTTWIAGTANQSKQDVITEYAHTAQPGPTVNQDTSIIDGLNRIYPLSVDDAEVSLVLNDILVDWEASEWQDVLAVQNLIDLLEVIPVQDWSSPNGFQGGP